MIKRVALLVLIFILSLSAPVLAAEAGSGIVEGQIVNGTEGGSSTADQDITLKTYLKDAEAGTRATKTNAQGRFTFTGLSTEPGNSYQLRVTFQGAEYNSERLSLTAEESTRFIDFTVYDSTTSDAAIKIGTALTIIYIGQGSLQVNEYYRFVNESDRTYIGSGEITATGTRKTLNFLIPGRATDLQYGGELMEYYVLGNEEGFTDTMPVLPGSKEIAYSYQVSYRSGEYTLSQRVNYPISDFHLLVQSESAEVASDQLVQKELVDIKGSWFNHLSGGGFVPGDTLVARLTSQPQATEQGAILWVALTLIVLTGGFGFVYLTRKGGLQPVRAKGSLDQQRQKLLVELAQLDDDFEEGKLPEEDYHRLRAVRKAQLVELMPRSKEEGGKR